MDIVSQLRRKKNHPGCSRKQGNEGESFKRKKKFFECNFCLAIAFAKITGTVERLSQTFTSNLSEKSEHWTLARVAFERQGNI